MEYAAHGPKPYSLYRVLIESWLLQGLLIVFQGPLLEMYSQFGGTLPTLTQAVMVYSEPARLIPISLVLSATLVLLHWRIKDHGKRLALLANYKKFWVVLIGFSVFFLFLPFLKMNHNL